MSDEKKTETKETEKTVENVVETTVDQAVETAPKEVKEKVEETSVDKAAETTPKAVKEKVVEAAADQATEAATEEVQEKVEEVVEEPPTAHDDFDWSVSNRNTISYSEDEIEKYLKEYEQTLTKVNENEIIQGKVTAISSGDVVLDINFKSDGIVPLSEFRDLGEIKVGDVVDVYVESQEDERGQLVLSRRKAKLFKAWENIVDSYKNGTIITGTVVSKTKGGLIADCGGLETFLPGSQIDIKPIIDYDIYVGKTMEFKVVKINETIKNAVISHKALIESDLADQREAIISSLEKGQVLEGIVKNITDFGAFMDLGGVDGLLYITDISWGRINHPNEILELNQKLNVVVLDFDENKKRISLGLKQLQPHPWEVLTEDVKEGSIVSGKIVNIEDYGAFLEISPGVEGLIHVSEVSWRTQPVNAREFFTLNQNFDSKVVTIDREERKMSLSIKQLSADPWDGIATKFPVESRHSGNVKNLTPYGVFVELEEGIGGMVHISDLSWTKRYSHPSEFTKVGEDIEIVILDIDSDSRKLSLGHKQIEENPWDTFSQVFPQGSYHEATVVKKEDRGAIVQLPYGLEAFCPSKHLKKEDGSFAEVDDTLTFKVIEFVRDDKRILVSHTRYLEDIKREADDVVKGEVRKERETTRKVVKSQTSKMEKTTIGDLGVFAQLKEQMAEAKVPAKKAPAKKVEEAPKAKETPKAEEVAKVEEAPKVKEATKVEKAPVEKAKAEKKTADAKPDDLKKIEGIGPKIAEKLVDAGINTFSELAAAKVERLKEILEEAGPRYKMHDPSSWSEQSALAADGKWDELKVLQDNLDGGKK